MYNKSRPWFLSSNTFQRIIAASIIGTLFLSAILWVDWLYYAIMGGSAVMMGIEWFKMAQKSPGFLLIGCIIICSTIVSLLYLKILAPDYRLLLLYFITIWAVDVFAMLAGKSLKGPKLAPKVSPNKTWSGFIIGILLAGAMAHSLGTLEKFADSYYSPLLIQNNIFLSGVMLATVAQLSDLFLSLFKRHFNIKDFSNAIPGHGGILDRFDSFVLTAPLVLLCLIIT